MFNFKTLLSISLFCLMANSAFAEEFKPSMRLIPKSLKEEFVMNLNHSQQMIKKARLKLNEQSDEWQRLGQIEEKIKQVCIDQDYDDELIVNQSTPSSMIVSLTCFEDNSIQKASVFILNIENQNELIEIAEIEANKVDSLKKLNLNISSKDDENKIAIILKQTIALAAGTNDSVQLAKLAYPGRVDSPKHAGYSAIISSISTMVARHFLKFSPQKSAQIGFGVCLVAGALKEWYDSKHPDKHQADWDDFIADTIGCARGAVLITYSRQF